MKNGKFFKCCTQFISLFFFQLRIIQFYVIPQYFYFCKKNISMLMFDVVVFSSFLIMFKKFYKIMQTLCIPRHRFASKLTFFLYWKDTQNF